jgi:hypothetical protein
MNDLLGRIASGDLKPYDRVPPLDDLRAGRSPGGAGYAVMPAGGPSPEDAAVREQLTQALQWVWDGAYEISTTDDGKLEAWRMDGSGTLHADTPEELRDAIRDDYGLHPVKML